MKKVLAILLVLTVALVSVFADGEETTAPTTGTAVSGPGIVIVQYEVKNKFVPAFNLALPGKTVHDDDTVIIAENNGTIDSGSLMVWLSDASYSNSDARDGYSKNGYSISFTYPDAWYKGNEKTPVGITVKTNLTESNRVEKKYYESLIISGEKITMIYKAGVINLEDEPNCVAIFELEWAKPKEDLDAGIYSATILIESAAL